jgi:MoaA/NifB/PqqE/SkfB family radical SAM enzyme
MTGGEPLLHPDLVELVRYAKRCIPMVGLLTNGFLLTQRGIASLNDANLDALQISVDGVFPNEITVKVLANLEEKLILLAEHARFKIFVSSVVGATDPREMLAVIDLCNQLNFVTTISVVHDGNGQFNLSENKRKEYAYANRVRKKPLWDTSHFYRRLMEQGECSFKCRSGSRYLYIDEFGKVQWCSQQRGVLDKPLHDYSFADLRTQFYKPKSCSERCTLNCARRASALDIWRKQARYS